MRINKLKIIVDQAINILYARDSHLLASDCSEWSVAHRLAVCFEELFPGWNIDCEFNRQGVSGNPKTTAEGSLVRPDIVVHHRGRTEVMHNLLVVELKKRSSSSDQGKACEYTRPPAGTREFQYRYGLTIVLEDVWTLTWFEGGSVKL